MRIKETYRDPANWGAHVYFARYEDGSTAMDKHGEPERFDYDEACALTAGATPAEVLANRTVKTVPPPPVVTVKTGKGRGRG